MINNKKAGVFALSVMAVMALASCGGTTPATSSKAATSSAAGTSTAASSAAAASSSKETLSQTSVSADTLAVWCPSTDNDVMTTLIANFKTANTAYASAKIVVTANVGEGDAAKWLTADKDACADVICAADDNIRAAVKAKALVSLDDDKAAFVTSDGQAAVDAACINGKMYGYPYRGDNMPLFIYDSSVITDPSKIETVLAAAKTAGKKVYFDVENGWYNPGFLWANGCTQSINADEAIATTFATDAGAAAAEALSELFKTYDGTFVNGSDNAVLEAGFKDGSIVGCFLWNDLANIQRGNTNAAVAKWPTVKIGTADKQIGAFLGTKDIVVRNSTALSGDKLTLAKAFAKYLAGADAQKARLTLGYGPSNLTVSASAEAQALPWVKGIAAQVAAGGAYSQAAATTGKYWDPMKNWGTNLYTNYKKTANWGDYGTGLVGAKAALVALTANEGWVAAE